MTEPVHKIQQIRYLLENFFLPSKLHEDLTNYVYELEHSLRQYNEKEGIEIEKE